MELLSPGANEASLKDMGISIAFALNKTQKMQLI